MLKPISTLRQLRRHAAERAAAGDRPRRFLSDRSGAMAVEFAMVALPLIFMLMSIMELALVFMVSSTLENATGEVSRKIRTGALQTAGGSTKTTFRNAVCAELGWLQGQCQTNLSVDVRVFSTFAGQNPPNFVSGGAFDDTQTTFQAGVAGDIILVRAFYRWKLVSPFLFGGLQRLSNGVTLLTATTTFRNEPYS